MNNMTNKGPNTMQRSFGLTNKYGEPIHERAIKSVPKRYSPESAETAPETPDAKPVGAAAVPPEVSHKASNTEVSHKASNTEVSHKASNTVESKPEISSKEAWTAIENKRKKEAEAVKVQKKAEAIAEAHKTRDISKIAAAHDMSVVDYVKFVNEATLGAPSVSKLTPEQEQAKAAIEWKKQQESEIQTLKKQVDDNKVENYIYKNMMPHLTKNTEKYELIMDNDPDEQCYKIYNFMNQHFLETGGPGVGEELDIVELLDAAEEDLKAQFLESEAKLQADLKAAAEKKAKYKKFQSMVKPDEAKASSAPDATKDVEMIPDSTGRMAKRIAAPKGVSKTETPDDKLAQVLSAEDSESALAESAPSNFVAGPATGSTPSNKRGISSTYGSTPKTSKYSRESRLARLLDEKPQ